MRKASRRSLHSIQEIGLLVAIWTAVLNTPAAASGFVANPACPEVSQQTSGVMSLGFEFDGTGSTHLRVNKSDLKPVSTPQDLIGCYVTTERVTNPQDALWQVGVIDKDPAGFYWKNAAGVSWRLSLDPEKLSLTTGPDNPYAKYGVKFNLILLPEGEVGPCKIRNAQKNFGAGFTSRPTRYFNLTQVIFKVVVPRFRDETISHEPRKTFEILELEQVEDFWTQSSYGRSKLVLQPVLDITVPGKSSDYNDGPGTGESKTNRLMQLVYQELSRMDPSPIHGLAVVFPTELDTFHAGYATSLDQLTGDRRLEHIGVSFVGSAPSRWGDPNAPIWKVLAHEIGHNYGLPDYYITSKAGRESLEWAGLTSGPFDIMAHLSAKANELLAWNRWKLGWLLDEEVTCLSKFSEPQSISVSPVASKLGGTKAVVVPKDPFSAVVVESRQSLGADRGLNGDETGLLVYTVDGRIGSGDGPIRVTPRVNEYTSISWTPTLPDKVRHLKAPLRPGDSVQIGDLTIQNIGTANQDRAFMYHGPDPRFEPTIAANLKSTYPLSVKSVTLKISSDSSGTISTMSANQSVCAVRGSSIQLRKAGRCVVVVDQPASDRHLRMQTSFSFEVTPTKSITCVKVKVVKKVSGADPKCPSDFKMKK